MTVSEDEIEQSFHKIIIKLVPELIDMLDEVRHKPISSPMFNSKVLPPWYDYYQKPFVNVILESLIATDTLDEILKIYRADNPFEETLNIFTPPIPYLGLQLPKNLSGKQTATILSLMKNFESILYNKKTINRLLYEIATGKDNDGSLIRQVLEVDRTAIHTEIIKVKLQDAVIAHNKKLINNISNSLYYNKNKKPKVTYPNLTFAIFILLDFDVYDSLDDDKKFKILNRYYEEHREPDSFYKECRRIRNALTTQKTPKRVREKTKK